MRSSLCKFSSAAALHRIFIAPIEHSALALPRLRVAQASPLCISHTQQRSFTRAPKVDTAIPERRLPSDGDIKAWSIYLVDENGKLSAPIQTFDVLDSMDRKTHTLTTVAMPSEQGNGPRLPICKIMNRKELHELEKAQKKKKVNPSRTVKTLELNWAIDGNDLSHRLGKMKGFLAKGFRVEIMLAAKKRGRQATMEEADNLVKNIRDAVSTVEGSKEWKSMDGVVGNQATVYFQGQLQASAQTDVAVKE
jgi:translation initiation factor IF-3